MNILFATQSGYLQLYYLFERFFKEKYQDLKTGYYISNYRNYERFLSQKNKEWPENRELLNEWDILNEALSSDVCVKDEEINEIEELVGDPTLWNVIVTDRRVFFGPKCVYTQDYVSRYSHDEMKKIVAVAYRKINEHIEKVQPDLILSFMCVTFGEYLYYLIAKKKGIRYLNVRDAKIGSYFTATDHVYRPEQEIKNVFNNSKFEDFSKEIKDEVLNYLSKFEEGRVTYDGQDYIHKRQKPSVSLKSILNIPRQYITKKIEKMKNPMICKDNQPDPFDFWFYNSIIKPLRYKKTLKAIIDRFVSLDQLNEIPFAFFPLHLEPEMSILMWGKPYLNQIELIRMIAISLPFNWKLVVKDHPKNPYYRKPGFLKRLKEIPNLLFIEHDASTNEIIKKSKMVVTLCGFVGFEALCLKKPAIALAGCIYEFMPKSMFRKVDNIRSLHEEINDLTKNFKYDEEAVKRFVASVIKKSFLFEWYSLGKKVRNYFEAPLEQYVEKNAQEVQFRRFIDYIETRINEKV